MKKKLLYIVLVWLAGIGAAFGQVTGKAMLTGQTIHSGIKVKFIAQSPTSMTDSTVTNLDGSFSKTVVPGLYQITFSKIGYEPVFNQNSLGQSVLLTSKTSLGTTYVLSGKYLFTKGSRKGKLSKDTVYIFTDNLIVNQGDTLKVEPGTTMSFYKNAKIIINGKFAAKGLNSDSITFTSYESLFEHKWPSSWGGFGGENYNDTLNLEFCKVLYLESSFWSESMGLVIPIEIWKGNIKILHCSFNYCPYVFAKINSGVYSLINNTSISNCIEVGNLGESGFANFKCNRVLYNGGIYTGVNRSTVYRYFVSSGLNQVENNLFDFNGYDNNGNRWILRSGGTKLRFKNNLLINFKNIYNPLTEQDDRALDVIFENNTFIGGAIDFTNGAQNPLTTPVYFKNNIFNTLVSVSNIFGHYNNVIATNSIFGNTTYGLTQQQGFGQKITTNANGDSVDTYFNLFQDPQFLNGKAPYLASNSPAIGAGIDENGNPVNIGFDPTGTCLESYFPKPNPVNTADTLSIAGLVHQGTGLLSDGVVIAVEKGSGKARYQKVNNGVFKIDSLRKSEYILYAVPNPVTVTGYLPTYYVNKVKLSEAIPLNLLGKIKDVDIYLVAKSSVASGNSTIQGRFSYADNNTDDTTVFGKNWFGNSNTPASPIVITENPCKNLPVLLYNSNNQLVQSTVTDIDGYFGFQNISSGTYKALGQRVNYSTENSGEVVVDQNNVATASLRLERIVSGIEEESAQGGSENVFAFPNPFKDELQLKGFNGKVSIYDLAGNLYFETTLQTNETINSSTWPSGFYLLKTGNKVQKLIKQE
jgi:hypothetical protein